MLIKIESRGPIFYRQERVGKNGRVFSLMKFRSMRVDAEKDGPVWAKTEDERTTRVGRIIRKIRVDEIPQFWNILRGDMNFVGPRPERPHFIAQLAKEIPFYEQRHLVAPGPDRLGPNQVSVRRVNRRRQTEVGIRSLLSEEPEHHARRDDHVRNHQDDPAGSRRKIVSGSCGTDFSLWIPLLITD